MNRLIFGEVELMFRSMFKTALRHPRRALTYLVFGPDTYNLVRAESMEQSVRPRNHLEAHMVRPTAIHEHLATLNMLTVELGLKTVVELGTEKGESTVALLTAAKRIGGRVYSIDVDPCLEARAMIKAYGLEKYWTFIQGASLKIKWDKPIDHLFVDTIHTFKQVIRELRKYEPHVRPGGIVTLHDVVTWPGVMRAANRYVRDRTDLRLYKYFNNNGLVVIFKG